MAKRIVMYTTTWCGDCRAAKKFLAAQLPDYYDEGDDKLIYLKRIR